MTVKTTGAGEKGQEKAFEEPELIQLHVNAGALIMALLRIPWQEIEIQVIQASQASWAGQASQTQHARQASTQAKQARKPSKQASQASQASQRAK